MSETEVAARKSESRRVQICRQWYTAFNSRRLDDLMALFDKQPRVSIGAGGSGNAVPYAGTFVGWKNVRWYYQMRFGQKSVDDETATEPLAPERRMRPFCMMQKQPVEYENWVMICAKMTDHKGISDYNGPYIHVFGFHGTGLKIASLDMYFVS